MPPSFWNKKPRKSELPWIWRMDPSKQYNPFLNGQTSSRMWLTRRTFHGSLNTPVAGKPSFGMHLVDHLSSSCMNQSCNCWGSTWLCCMAYSIVRNLAYPSRLNLLSVYLVFLTTIPAIFTQTYHERIGVAGLNYIALGIGLTTAAQVGIILDGWRQLISDEKINARYIDKIYIWLKNTRGNGVGEPEFRMRTLCLPQKLDSCYIVLTCLV